jgi:hypothetical protein
MILLATFSMRKKIEKKLTTSERDGEMKIVFFCAVSFVRCLCGFSSIAALCYYEIFCQHKSDLNNGALCL